MASSHTYILRQITRSTQALTSTRPDAPREVFDIKISGSSGIFSRKAAIAISSKKSDGVCQIAAVKFDLTGPGISIKYEKSDCTERLSLDDPQSQRYTDGMNHHWLPTESKALELTDGDTEKLVARFKYSGQVNYWGLPTPMDDGTIGELSIIPKWTHDEDQLEQIICSAIAVVEKRKRSLSP
jgi:hypothetical protein